jgi:hypothetical protein
LPAIPCCRAGRPPFHPAGSPIPASPAHRSPSIEPTCPGASWQVRPARVRPSLRRHRSGPATSSGTTRPGATRTTRRMTDSAVPVGPPVDRPHLPDHRRDGYVEEEACPAHRGNQVIEPTCPGTTLSDPPARASMAPGRCRVSGAMRPARGGRSKTARQASPSAEAPFRHWRSNHPSRHVIPARHADHPSRSRPRETRAGSAVFRALGRGAAGPDAAPAPCIGVEPRSDKVVPGRVGGQEVGLWLAVLADALPAQQLLS